MKLPAQLALIAVAFLAWIVGAPFALASDLCGMVAAGAAEFAEFALDRARGFDA